MKKSWHVAAWRNEAFITGQGLVFMTREDFTSPETKLVIGAMNAEGSCRRCPNAIISFSSAMVTLTGYRTGPAKLSTIENSCIHATLIVATLAGT